ncbi:hypothetical protein SS50377_23340 [Spironucleus salmonicida]|uniref:Uncharacterized protein n=1 Tax=Spironucleus salmonicida TaxID=348837 RepID=A0A9P8LWT2_9EUKA|nr:hypothetical protein SS50377_23340 [Spironucleus salmonicida]
MNYLDTFLQDNKYDKNDQVIEKSCILSSFNQNISHQLEQKFDIDLITVLELKTAYTEIILNSPLYQSKLTNTLQQSLPNLVKIESDTIQILKDTQYLIKINDELVNEISRLKQKINNLQDVNKINPQIIQTYNTQVDINKFIKHQQRQIQLQIQETQVMSAFQLNKILSELDQQSFSDLDCSTDSLQFQQPNAQLNCHEQIRTLQITLKALEKTLINDHIVLNNMRDQGFEQTIQETEGIRNSAYGFHCLINHIGSADYWIIVLTLFLTAYFIIFTQ